jgi:peptidoglycan hydrolase-like protein with peptidoglycan-binding domain
LGGVANFPPLPHRLAKRRDDDGEPGINVTPPVLFEQYGVPATPLASNANSSQAVAEFEQDSYYESDIPAFQKMFNLSLVVPTQVGWNDPSKGYLGACVRARALSFSVASLTAPPRRACVIPPSLSPSSISLLQASRVSTSSTSPPWATACRRGTFTRTSWTL